MTSCSQQFVVILQVLCENVVCHVNVPHIARSISRRFHSCVNYVLGAVTANQKYVSTEDGFR
jgi:hypothetical protein